MVKLPCRPPPLCCNPFLTQKPGDIRTRGKYFFAKEARFCFGNFAALKNFPTEGRTTGGGYNWEGHGSHSLDREGEEIVPRYPASGFFCRRKPDLSPSLQRRQSESPWIQHVQKTDKKEKKEKKTAGVPMGSPSGTIFCERHKSILNRGSEAKNKIKMVRVPPIFSQSGSQPPTPLLPNKPREAALHTRDLGPRGRHP